MSHCHPAKRGPGVDAPIALDSRFAGMTSEVDDDRHHRDHDAEMGPDDDRGHGRGLAQAAGPALCRGRGDPRDRDPKITNVVEAPSGGTLRRIVAPAGATLPVGALLAVMAARRGAGSRDRRVRRRVRRRRTRRPARKRKPKAVKPRDIEVAGRRLRYLELGEGDGVPVLLVHGFGADLNTWMFTQPALAAGRRARRVGSAGAWRLGQGSRCRRRRKLDRCRRGRAGHARHQAGSPRRTFDGRRDRGTRGIAAAGAGRDPDLDRLGRARARDQCFVYRRLCPRVAPPRSDRGAGPSDARPGARQPRHGRGCPALQTARRCFGGAGQDRRGVVCRRPAVARFARSDRSAGDAGSARSGAARTASFPSRMPRPSPIACRCIFSMRPAISRIWKKRARSIG